MTADTSRDEARSEGLRHHHVRDIIALGAPLLLAAVVSSASGPIDTAMMGHFSRDGLSAVAGAAAVFDLLASVVLASAVAHQILAARFAGAGDTDAVRTSFVHTARWAGGLALLLVIVCEVAGGPLCAIVAGGDPRLEGLGAQYLAARAPTLLLLVVFAMVNATLNAHKISRYALVTAVIVNVVNLLLDVLLIYGVGFFPQLGVVGNGLATTLSWAIGVGYLLVVSAQHGFGLVSLLRPRVRTLPSVEFETSTIRLGWPGVVSAVLDYGSLLVFFALVGAINADSLAAGRLAFELYLFVFAATSAFAAAARIMIGRSLGGGRADDVARYRRAVRQLLILLTLAVAVAITVLRYPVAGLLTSSEPVARSTAATLPMVGLVVVLMAWTWGSVCVLRAMGRTRWDMWANATAAVAVQLPLTWLFTGPLGWGVGGAFAAVLAYWAARAITSSVFVRRLTPVVPAPTAPTGDVAGRTRPTTG